MRRKLWIGLAACALGLALWQVGVRREAGVTISPVSIALAALNCNCPDTFCQHGKVAGCTSQCPPGQEAICVCSGFCDNNGNPGGMNKCSCQ